MKDLRDLKDWTRQGKTAKKEDACDDSPKAKALSLSRSLSLSHTHTHTLTPFPLSHTHTHSLSGQEGEEGGCLR